MGKIGIIELLILLLPVLVIALVLFVILKPPSNTKNPNFMMNQEQKRMEAIILSIDPNSAPDAIDPDAPVTTQDYQHQGSAPVGSTRPGGPPKNWLTESILVTLFCCLPFGIAGIINATNVNSRFAAGDVAGAAKASEEAKKWMKIGFFIGIGLIALYLIYALVLGGAALRFFR